MMKESFSQNQVASCVSSENIPGHTVADIECSMISTIISTSCIQRYLHHVHCQRKACRASLVNIQRPIRMPLDVSSLVAPADVSLLMEALLNVGPGLWNEMNKSHWRHHSGARSQHGLRPSLEPISAVRGPWKVPLRWLVTDSRPK